MIEVAIVLPLLLLLTLGVLEWGWIFFRISQVNQAARHGVRVAVRPAATQQDVTEAVATIMNGAGFSSSDYEMTTTSVNVSAGETVTVTVIVDYEKLKLIGFAPTPSTLNGSATMAKEGPPS